MADRPPRWNAALAYAITGRLWELAESGKPDPQLVAYEIEQRFPDGVSGLRTHIDGRLHSGQPWPYDLPADLRSGLGAAQWHAALTGLRQQLVLGRQPRRPVLSDRQPDADEQRLLREVPPHHGS